MSTLPASGQAMQQTSAAPSPTDEAFQRYARQIAERLSLPACQVLIEAALSPLQAKSPYVPTTETTLATAQWLTAPTVGLLEAVQGGYITGYLPTTLGVAVVQRFLYDYLDQRAWTAGSTQPLPFGGAGFPAVPGSQPSTPYTPYVQPATQLHQQVQQVQPQRQHRHGRR